MGSTVSTNKQAYAFVTPQNKTAYVLFEETFEKNCIPHTTSWSCVGLGYLEETLAIIFRFASYCEGGGLQHRSGHVLPETYLQRWLETLAEPLAMPNVSGTLDYSESFYATIPLGMKEKIEDSLRCSGRSYDVESLNGREVMLHKDFDLLRAIYGKCDLGPWRFIRNHPFNTGIYRKDLGYTASLRTTRQDFTPSKMKRCGPEHIFMQQPNGEYENGGWAYSVVAKFIRGYAQTECASPGAFKAAFKAFRKATETAEQLSDSTQIEITVPTLPTLGNKDSYSRRQAMKVVDIFAPGQSCLTISLGQVLEKEKVLKGDDSHALHNLLNCDLARWFSASLVQHEAVQLELEIA